MLNTIDIPAASRRRLDTVMAALRQGTRIAHDRLEAALDLPRELGEPARLARVIERFYGFHAAWEPAIGDAIGDPAFWAPRRKLAILREDLRALGHGEAEIESLPVCSEARRLAREPWGSLYVLEGSTLGGQIIARHLAGLRDVPAPLYFTPYGDQTGAMWRATQGRLGEAAAETGIGRMVASASATFDLLHDWLIPDARTGHERAP